MRQLIHVTPLSAVLPVLLVVMMVVMCCAGGCFAASLTYSCSFDKVMRADRAKSIAAVVRDVPFGSEGASQTCTVIGRKWMGPHPHQCVDKGPGWHQEVLQLGAVLRNEFIGGYCECEGDVFLC
ncbi:hypothetical protein TcG_09116 [Trypanosoma cruzi]|nr:hypothetical protein TcG_09116 [Trypanosoma cruzi]